MRPIGKIEPIESVGRGGSKDATAGPSRRVSREPLPVVRPRAWRPAAATWAWTWFGSWNASVRAALWEGYVERGRQLEASPTEILDASRTHELTDTEPEVEGPADMPPETTG